MIIENTIEKENLTRKFTQLLHQKNDDIVREIMSIEFDAEIQYFVDLYESVGKRNSYVWKWALHDTQLIQLSCVDSEYFHTIRLAKLLYAIINVLIDDIADELQNAEIIQELSSIIHTQTKKDSENQPQTASYTTVFREIWESADSLVRKLPRYSDFEMILKFDIEQLLNSHLYSLMINKNLFFDNEVEHLLYSPHQMNIMLFGTVDLMASRNFKMNELGKLREITWYTSLMYSTIHNLATWRREVPNGDFTSKVIVRALDRGIIAVHDLSELEIGRAHV